MPSNPGQTTDVSMPRNTEGRPPALAAQKAGIGLLGGRTGIEDICILSVCRSSDQGNHVCLTTENYYLLD